MIQFKDLVFSEWYESRYEDFKSRDAEAGNDFMRIEVMEYVSDGKRYFSLKWSGYAFQMEAEYGNDHVGELKDENALNKAIEKEVYGRIEWLKEECDKFLAL